MPSLKRHASPSNASCCHCQHHHLSCCLCLSFSQYLSVSLVSLFSTSCSLPAAVSLFLFLYLLLQGDTSYAHTPFILSEQLVLESRERERKTKRKKKNKQRKWKNALIHTKRNGKSENLITCLFLPSAHPPLVLISVFSSVMIKALYHS